MEATKNFRAYEFHGYQSTYFPVFVNLVDNSAYWVKERAKKRRIVLDAEDTTLIVSDNGPGIKDWDTEQIFERGFSRKKGGRGLGLYITKQVLAEQDLEILAISHPQGEGAEFRIIKR